MTIKNYTDNTIFRTDLDISTRLLKTKAAQEHLDQLTKVLEKDQQLLMDIYRSLGISSDDDIWNNIPVDDAHSDITELHKSYLNLLARCIHKSNSSDFSEGLRSRFAISAFIVNPKTANLNNTNAALLRSKFINLWDLHGVIQRPGFLQRLFYRFFKLFSKHGKENDVKVY